MSERHGEPGAGTLAAVAPGPPPGTVHIGALLRRAALSAGPREAIVFEDGRLTYAELYDRALARAAALRRLGLAPGDHVGLLLSNRPEFVELLLGSALAGCVAVLFNARYKAHELRHVIADSGAAVLITSRAQDGAGYDFPAELVQAFPDLAGQAAGSLSVAGAPRLDRVYTIDAPASGPFETYDDLLALADERAAAMVQRELAARSAAEPFIMLYTSGTTSMPKGCRLSHVNVVGKGIAFGQRFRVVAGSRVWNPLPMFHVGFVMPLASTLAVGATHLGMRRFEPDAALRMLAGEQATHAFPAFPQLWQSVIDHPRFDADALTHLRHGLLVGPAEMLRRAQRATPRCPFISCYGMTEGTSVFTAPHLGDPEAVRLGTEGQPFPGLDLRIVDPLSGEDLACGEVGEIQIRGYSVAREYYGDPARTAEAFIDGGWFRTGDLGAVDEHGNLSFRGRSKDMLKVGGENVATTEVESYLMTHPDIVMAQVVGVPDARLTEVAAAFIELRPGSALTPPDVVAHCQGRISTFKIPRYVTVVSEWPMSATKIQKRILAERPPGPRLLPDRPGS